MGVSFIFQNCHAIVATDLRYFCRTELQRRILGTGFLFHCVSGESASSVCPCNLTVQHHFIIKLPPTAYTWGRLEDEGPPPPNPQLGEGDFTTSCVKCSPWTRQFPDRLGKGLRMWEPGQRKPCLAAKSDYSGLSLLGLLDLNFIGWRFSDVLNAIFLFYLPEEKKKKPFWNGAISCCLGSSTAG